VYNPAVSEGEDFELETAVASIAPSAKILFIFDGYKGKYITLQLFKTQKVFENQGNLYGTVKRGSRSSETAALPDGSLGDAMPRSVTDDAAVCEEGVNLVVCE
jgi:hypothetical protein